MRLPCCSGRLGGLVPLAALLLALAACGGGGSSSPDAGAGDGGPSSDALGEVAAPDVLAVDAPDAALDAAPPDSGDDVPGGGPDVPADVPADVRPADAGDAADASPDAPAPDVPAPDVPATTAALVITELFIDPCLSAEEDGEWIELLNVGTAAVDLNGWTITDDDGADEHVVSHPLPLLVQPGQRLVLGAERDQLLNGGVAVRYAWDADVRLANSRDEVVLLAPDGTLADRVAWGGDGPAAPACASLSLDPAATDAVANDDPDAWCPATTPFGWGDYGTPGLPNAACPEVPPCGNGRIDVGEDCDDGADNSDTRPDACRTDCTAAGCGDGVRDAGEACDNGTRNSDTAPNACRRDCTLWRCGDGVPDGGEECDDGNDESGDGCEPDCTSTWECGNGVEEPGEECDDGEANSDSEPDACRTDCSAARCGDEVLDRGEECDAGAFNDDRLPDACRTDCRVARCGDRVVDTGEECDDGDNQPNDGCDALCREEPPGAPRPTVAGQLVITEIMKNPAGVADDDGEWIEVYNRTPLPLGLDGCHLTDGAFDDHVIASGGAFVLPAYRYVVLGRNPDPDVNGGVPVDYVYGSFLLGNGDDVVAIVCGGLVIDRVAYTDAGFPDVPGRSLSLDPAWTDAVANDDGSRWCPAGDNVPLSGGTNYGTPGAPNPVCPPVPQCGDGVPEGDEACDDGADNSDTEPNACRTDCVLPSCGDGVTDDASGESCDDGGRADGDGCSADCRAETGAFPAAAGELVINELMKDPVAIVEAHGEWVEIANPGRTPLDLDGCVLEDLTGDAHLIDASGALVVQPGGRVVLASSGDPIASDGVPADYVYDRAEFRLDVVDEVVLTCGDVVIDALVYEMTLFPSTPGRSLSLDPRALDAVANDDGGAWCAGAALYGSYNAGTPGAPNPTCPAPPRCGDGRREGAEECDRGLFNSDVVPDRCRTNCRNPSCGDGVVDSGETCDDGNRSSGDGCSTLCVDEGARAPSAPGQVILTELMLDPAPLPATNEWFELTNVSGIRLDLGGCRVDDGVGGGFDLPASFPLPAAGPLVLAAVADPAGDGSVVPAYVYSRAALPLGDAAGTLVLRCGALELDRVSWDADVGWPVAAGHALSLDGLVRSHVANDLLFNWCPAPVAFGGGAAWGSPGALNERCPGTCGNTIVEWDEECDQGLANSDSEPDRCRSDCTAPSCGDGVRDSGEGCDDGNDESGDGCTPACTTEMPTECGNGVPEVGEECDEGAANSNTEPDRCRENCRRARCGDGVVDAREDCDPGRDVPGDGCTAQCGFDYEPQRPTTAGQLYVTELLARPTSGGEWFEILNDHSWPLDLQGCQLTDGGAQSWFVDGPLVVEPGSWLVFAAAADPAGDGSVAVDHVYDPARFSLAAVDRVRLVCGGVLIDRVRLDGAGFPLVPGAAAALDPQAFSGTANDAPGNWCAATATYGTGGQRGTPGALNDDCGLTAICGDGAEEPGEECDDGAFNSPTARDACRGDCRLPACGDGVVDSGEGCDDENLADGDGCSAQCVREPVCGDGALDLGEGCDDGPANSDVRPDACRSDCRPARCGDGVVDAGEDCDDGARVAGDGCSPLCEFDAAPEPARVPGQVVFSEILADPAVLPDEVGEWIELTSGDLGVYDLDGCVVSAGGGDSVTITGPGALLVGPGQYRVLAPSADPAGDGSVTPALVYPWTSLSLANAGDTLALTCGGVVIDRVTWTPDAWPVATGASLALDPSALTAGANDRPGAWCAGAAPYGVGANRGTPGRPNPSCGHAAICGNDRLEPGEGCDDGDANSDVLPDACRWDCQPARCGDRVIDGAEDCDDGGTVAGDGCGATCLAEGTCGNGELEPGEACDDGPLNSDTLPDRCRRDCRAARCGDRVVDTGETCDDGDALGGDGCSAACTWEPLAAPTTAGALVFSEVMVDPVGADDAVGEWFELWNASDRIFDLQGCRIDSAGEAGFDLFGPLVVYGGAALVFAASGDPAGNGDVLPDYVFGRAEAALASTADGLTLRCGAVVIDALAWDPALDWPLAPGRSLSLDPRSLDADANDLPASWCEGSAPYGPAGADAGTPGAPNPFCP